MRRSRPLALLVCLIGSGASAAEERAARDPRGAACRAARSDDRVEAITPRGEIRLASGRTALLSGIRLPEEPGPAIAWLKGRRRQAVEVVALGSGPDRWGRIAAHVGPSDGGTADFAAGLVEAGLAFVDAGEADALCRPALLGLEAGARQARRGLWAAGEGGPGPIAAGDRARLRGALGRFVLVAGRVRTVGERRARTYLNFGTDWTEDLTVTIPKRAWRTMLDNGLSAAALRGRRVRVRGVLEAGRGPTIEVVAADMLEMVDEAPAAPIGGGNTTR